jgi:uncharacterized membrane protein (DUF485 family)
MFAELQTLRSMTAGEQTMRHRTGPDAEQGWLVTLAKGCNSTLAILSCINDRPPTLPRESRVATRTKNNAGPVTRSLNKRGEKMNEEIVDKVKANPKFAELVAQRNRYSWTLAILMLVIYYGFIFLVAFDKPLLDIKIGTTTTLAFPIGLGVILAAIIITGLYVRRANNVYDPMTRAIVEDAR